MINIDYHLHSNYSDDSDTSMEEMINSAISKNLTEVAFTDHIDLIYPIQINYGEYIKHFEKLKESYSDKIKITLGVEIGLSTPTNEQNRMLAEEYPFDFIIGSTHDVYGDDIYVGNYFIGKDKRTAYGMYFEEMLQNIKTCDFFSVYGHLDAIIRYGVYDDNYIKYGDYSEILDEILKELIKRDKGIELNTSGYKYKLNQTHPSMEILARYKELGGKIVTVGSDAHTAWHIADRFDIAEEILKSLDYKEVCVFRNRQPEFIKI